MPSAGPKSTSLPVALAFGWVLFIVGGATVAFAVGRSIAARPGVAPEPAPPVEAHAEPTPGTRPVDSPPWQLLDAWVRLNADSEVQRCFKLPKADRADCMAGATAALKEIQLRVDPSFRTLVAPPVDLHLDDPFPHWVGASEGPTGYAVLHPTGEPVALYRQGTWYVWDGRNEVAVNLPAGTWRSSLGSADQRRPQIEVLVDQTCSFDWNEGVWVATCW